ncbi:MAG TPA: anaerobic ribonucleoside-triphosphate reductase [Spirochaetota bacterium]|nr:anaerobic ribonucleoside-triphosphate reductase [Spirochaetota bacterium]HOL56492.1 anaerobic ribonucleoside-triphosphate reductase [Spirochaetota bacterium]HPP03929.1 anaerobic ribonucleoside-triphosphate reductase [Spirochaetota bacterium]
MQTSIFDESLGNQSITNKTEISYNSIEEIDKRIVELEKKLKEVKGKETEVYTRIVGYHRDVKNWNNGKKEEYKYRVTFDIELKSIKERLDLAKKDNSRNEENINQKEIAFYKVFHSHTCRNCPPVLNFLKTVNIPGEEIDVLNEIGFNSAKKYNIMSTPAVVLFDKEDRVITIVNSLEKLKEIFKN